MRALCLEQGGFFPEEVDVPQMWKVCMCWVDRTKGVHSDVRALVVLHFVSYVQ